MLKTEQTNPLHTDLDTYATPDLVSAFVDDQLLAVQAVQRAAQSLSDVVDAAVPRIAAGGRLMYFGAGTSGRLGLLDSVELHPTFSWEHDRAVARLAGGSSALSAAVEGAEDDTDAGAADLNALAPDTHDVVLLIAASGRTPYVLGALRAARAAGALSVAIVNNPDSPIALEAELAVLLDTGPEVISGSTRLKAGTAQKIALNTLSSAIMVRLNKVYGNLMVDMRATNSKLVRRAINLTADAARVPTSVAEDALRKSNFQVKTAIVALRCGISAQQAQDKLDAVAGSVRRAVIQAPGVVDDIGTVD